MQQSHFLLGLFLCCNTYSAIAQCSIPFEIGVPFLTIDLDCGDTLQLRVTPPATDSVLQIQWTTTNGNILSGEKSVTPVISAIGSYEVTISATINQEVCVDKKQILVESFNREPLNIAFPDGINCNQKEVELEAIDNVDPSEYRYEWMTSLGNIVSDPNQRTITVNSSGVYSLRRTDILGECSTELGVIVLEEKIVDFNFEFLPPTCEQTTALLSIQEVFGGSGDYDYSIDGGVTFEEGPDFFIPKSGDYNLVIRDTNNDCQFTKEVNFSFTPILQQISLLEEKTLKKGATYQLPLSTNLPDSLIQEIQWMPTQGLSCTDCLSPTVTANLNQTYNVRVTDINGCQVEASIDIVVSKSMDIYIPNSFSPNFDGINDRFTIFVNTRKISNIQQLLIFDRFGSLIFEQHDFLPNQTDLGWDGRYRDRDMPVGVYAFLAKLERTDGSILLQSGGISLVR